MRRLLMISVLAAIPACASRKPAVVSPPQKEPSLPAKAPAAAQLPVTTVALYAGGAAYIEHKGIVQDDPMIELRFKGGQIAGVLKTMVVQDGDASNTATVQPLEPPATQSSEDDRLDLSSNPTLVDMLQQLRGTKVKIHSGGATQEVTILSLEKREEKKEKDKEKDKDKSAGEAWYLNVLDGGAIRAIPMEGIGKIELSDERAQQELSRSLESLWHDADQPRRAVAVHLRGQGPRPVRIGYALEAEPWKITYRLNVSDKPALQAWATVNNDTASDWNHVQLNLMSSGPVILGQGGSIDANSVGKAARGAGVPAGESLRRAKPVPSRQALDEAPDAVQPLRRPAELPSASSPLVNPREIFRHTVADVTIPRRGTVGVAILSDAIAVEPVAVFNESLLKRNALLGARIRNTTKHYLLQGPVAVLDEGEYAGDATLENLAPGRFGLATWGIDLALQVDASHESSTTAVKVARIDKGVLQLSRNDVYTREYFAENEGQKDRALIIEHPIRRGWRLLQPAEPMDFTENLYRFRTTVPAGKQTTLVVKEQTTEAESIDLLTADLETVQTLSRDKELPADVRDALEKMLPLKQQLLDQERQAQQQKSAETEPNNGTQPKAVDDPAAQPDADAMGDIMSDAPAAKKKSKTDTMPAVVPVPENVLKARKELEDYVNKLNAGK